MKLLKADPREATHCEAMNGALSEITCCKNGLPKRVRYLVGWIT